MPPAPRRRAARTRTRRASGEDLFALRAVGPPRSGSRARDPRARPRRGPIRSQAPPQSSRLRKSKRACRRSPLQADERRGVDHGGLQHVSPREQALVSALCEVVVAGLTAGVFEVRLLAHTVVVAIEGPIVAFVRAFFDWIRSCLPGALGAPARSASIGLH